MGQTEDCTFFKCFNLTAQIFTILVCRLRTLNNVFFSLRLSQQRPDGFDMNVKAAWKKGYTGRGVVVSILDDGIEKDHPDLKRNYVSKPRYLSETLAS